MVSGELPDGDRLPTEPQLQEQYGCWTGPVAGRTRPG
ncbi:hypothetical protein [Micromonospora coxensis]